MLRGFRFRDLGVQGSGVDEASDSGVLGLRIQWFRGQRLWIGGLRVYPMKQDTCSEEPMQCSKKLSNDCTY